MKRILLDIEDEPFENGMMTLSVFGMKADTEYLGTGTSSQSGQTFVRAKAYGGMATNGFNLSDDFNHITIDKDGNFRIGHFMLMDVFETLIPKSERKPYEMDTKDCHPIGE